MAQAKKNEKDEAQTTAVALATAGGAQVPAYLQNYAGPMGTENIETKDITVPRLKIGQGTSDEVKDKSVDEGALFLNVGGQCVWKPGDAPLPAIVVGTSKEFILWRPRKDNSGGLLARAKPVKDGGITRYKWDQPNTDFDVKVEGVVKAKWHTQEYVDQDGLSEWGSEIPGDPNSGIAATAHHNYVVFLPTLGMVAAVSMSRSQVKKAKDLNYLLTGTGNAPIFARKLTLSTIDETSDENKYKNWQIKPDGFVDEATFAKTKAMFDNFAKQGFTVDQSDGGDQTAGAETAAGGKASSKVR